MTQSARIWSALPSWESPPTATYYLPPLRFPHNLNLPLSETASQTANHLQIAQTVTATAAEGPGMRFAIWLQGCPLRCPGCCNPEMLPFEGGRLTSTSELMESVARAVAETRVHGHCVAGETVEGITLMGGEPFSQAASVAELAASCQSQGLSVMIFSGHTLCELQLRADAGVARLLKHTDILVDGPYLRQQPDTTRRWIGSRNQQIHFLSQRYASGDDCWRQADTLEIRYVDGELQVNGFPAKSAVSFWRRPAQVSNPKSK